MEENDCSSFIINKIAAADDLDKSHDDVIKWKHFHVVGRVPVTGEFPVQRPVTRRFDIFFDVCPKKNGWVNNGEAGDLRRHRTHYDVSVMKKGQHFAVDNCNAFSRKEKFWLQSFWLELHHIFFNKGFNRWQVRVKIAVVNQCTRADVAYHSIFRERIQ